MPETRFRKRPIVVTAIQWTGDNEAELRDWTNDRFESTAPGDYDDPEITAIVYDDLHSTWVGVKTGQWVIEGVQDEHYPIDETVLAEIYDRLGPGDA